MQFQIYIYRGIALTIVLISYLSQSQKQRYGCTRTVFHEGPNIGRKRAKKG